MSSISSLCSSSINEETLTNDTEIDPLRGEGLTDFINGLSGILNKWEQNENDRDRDQYIEIKNKLIRINNDDQTIQRRYLHCWIEPVKVINKTAFEFEYRLYIEHKKDLYYSTFVAVYRQIKKLHKIASTSIHFPTRGYPTVYSGDRTQELKDDMEQEQNYMLLEKKLKYKGPGRKSFTLNTAREAEHEQLEYFGEILCKLFNCPSFAIQNKLYEILNEDTEEKKEANGVKNINDDLVKLLKHIAYRKLLVWRHSLKYMVRKYHIEQKEHADDEKHALYKAIKKNGNVAKGEIKYVWKRPEALIKDQKFLSNITFHSITVASRPNGVSDHWAVIFEGKYHLLVLEYFLDPKSKEDLGFVSFKLMPNNIIGQRACWYSFNVSRREEAINAQLFNERWSTLRKSFLPNSPFKRETTFTFIHNLVKIWMSKPEYYMTSNNCQHFARSIYAAFDKGEAKFLNIKLDHRKMTIFIPSGPIGDIPKEGCSMGMFVAETRKKIKFKEEDTCDNFGDIGKEIGIKEFIYEEDEEKNGNGNDVEEEDNEEKARQLLLAWRIPEQYIDTIIANMIKEDCIDPVNDWEDLIEDKNLMLKLGFTPFHSKRFGKECIKWSNNGKK